MLTPRTISDAPEVNVWMQRARTTSNRTDGSFSFFFLFFSFLLPFFRLYFRRARANVRLLIFLSTVSESQRFLPPLTSLPHVMCSLRDYETQSVASFYKNAVAFRASLESRYFDSISQSKEGWKKGSTSFSTTALTIQQSGDTEVTIRRRRREKTIESRTTLESSNAWKDARGEKASRSLHVRRYFSWRGCRVSSVMKQ